MKMKEEELSKSIKRLKNLKEKYRYHQINIDILKESYWNPYEHYYIDKDVWERQKIEEIKSQGQILKTLEEEIRNLKKHIKQLNREQNKRNDSIQSLEDRLQYQWKPSEEQLKALNTINVTGCITEVGQGKSLVELYEQLKKLKEE